MLDKKDIILEFIISEFGGKKGHYSYCLFPEGECTCRHLSTASYDTSLIRGGYVDSFSMINVLVFLEKTFNVRIPDDKATADHFDTVNKMVDVLDSLGV